MSHYTVRGAREASEMQQGVPSIFELGSQGAADVYYMPVGFCSRELVKLSSTI